MPPRGFELVTSGSDTMIIIRKTKKLELLLNGITMYINIDEVCSPGVEMGYWNFSIWQLYLVLGTDITLMTFQAGLKIIQSYMEGYRQDWGLSFQKDTVAKGGWYVKHLL